MKPQIGFFFTELLGSSLIINLAQLVSPSVALPAELVQNKNVSGIRPSSISYSKYSQV